MRVAVEGCCHGELDAIYQTIEHLEKQSNAKVDLLLVCGDFQSVRNKTDMNCMAVPPKHRKINTFYKYYSGEKVAPVLTVFIGGNHEASNYLQSLPYGGWVAPNIYYMGYAGVVQFGGVRIGGMSGIYKGKDYMKGHFEHPPYSEETKRSVYHLRNLEVFRLKQLQQHVDIFLSHDWPRGIHLHGNVEALLKRKQFFREEVENNTLGNPIAADLLHKLKPSFWFSAHLHVKFPALVQHIGEDNAKITKFLALDKCLPRRQFLQVLDIPHDPSKPLKLELDAEWLCILKATNHLLSLSKSHNYPASQERSDFAPSEADLAAVRGDFGGNLCIPENFNASAPAYNPSASENKNIPEATTEINPQTTLLCSMLDLTDPNAVFLGKCSTFALPNDEPDTAEDQSGEGTTSDDDYESEASFASLSGNDSFSCVSVENDNNIRADDQTQGLNLGKSVSMKLATRFDEDNDEEFKEIMARKNSSGLDSGVISDKSQLSRNGTLIVNPEIKVEQQSKISEEECREKVATERRKSLNLSMELPLLLKSTSSGSGSSSFADSSLDCKSLDVSDDDPELQEMLKLQRSMSVDVDKSVDAEVSKDVKDADKAKTDAELTDGLVPLRVAGCVSNNGDRDSNNDGSSDVSSVSDKVQQIKQDEEDRSLRSPAMKKFKRRNQSFYTDNGIGEGS